MKDEGFTPSLPDNPAPYLIKWLFEIGPTVSTSMGESRIEWTHIKAWQETMGVELYPWEAQTLRFLSGEFLDQRGKSRKADCPAPYVDQAQENRDAVSRQVASLFGGLAKRKDSR